MRASLINLTTSSAAQMSYGEGCTGIRIRSDAMMADLANSVTLGGPSIKMTSYPCPTCKISLWIVARGSPTTLNNESPCRAAAQSSALPCGSASMSNTRKPSFANCAARLTLNVVFPTPPFWLSTPMTIPFPLFQIS